MSRAQISHSQPAGCVDPRLQRGLRFRDTARQIGPFLRTLALSSEGAGDGGYPRRAVAVTSSASAADAENALPIERIIAAPNAVTTSACVRTRRCYLRRRSTPQWLERS